MAGRTLPSGDIHGDAEALYKLLACFPELNPSDTIVFVGDYIDRGPQSKEVVAFIAGCPGRRRQGGRPPGQPRGRVAAGHRSGLAGVHLPITNGCLATLRSFLGLPVPEDGEPMKTDELPAILKGSFFPPDVVAWMRELPFFYEDEHAIYVHAGLPHGETGFPHPSEVKTPTALLWCRDDHFFRRYTGKLVVFGHTATELLPPELSSYTPEDPSDIWAGPCTIGLDTGCGKGGFLTGLSCRRCGSTSRGERHRRRLALPVSSQRHPVGGRARSALADGDRQGHVLPRPGRGSSSRRSRIRCARSATGTTTGWRASTSPGTSRRPSGGSTSPLVGHAYAPRGEPATSIVARLAVGDLVKAVQVTGDRSWTMGTGKHAEPARPPRSCGCRSATSARRSARTTPSASI